MSSITSLASIAAQARAAAARGAGAQANPYPPLDPVHAVWADCHAAASECLAVRAMGPAPALAEQEAAHA